MSEKSPTLIEHLRNAARDFWQHTKKAFTEDLQPKKNSPQRRRDGSISPNEPEDTNRGIY